MATFNNGKKAQRGTVQRLNSKSRSLSQGHAAIPEAQRSPILVEAGCAYSTSVVLCCCVRVVAHSY